MKSLAAIWSYSIGPMQMLDRSPPKDSSLASGLKFEPPVASSVASIGSSFFDFFFFSFEGLSMYFLRALFSFSFMKIWLSLEALREKISSLYFYISPLSLLNFSFKFSIDNSSFLTYFLSILELSIAIFLNYAASLF